MELRHVRYFLAVAEEGHFTRAAKRLGIAQPPLSAQIKDLEGEIGALLFRRLAHGAELTEAGRALRAAVADLPERFERGITAARRAARGQTGAIRVGYTASSSFNVVVPHTLRAFRRDYPDVELALREANTAILAAALADGSLDAAFVRPAPELSGRFQFLLLSEETMLVAMPADHPRAGDEPVELASLARDPFLLFPREVGPTLYDLIVGACRGAGFEPVGGPTVPQLATAVNLVAASLGVAIVPASMAGLGRPGVVFRTIAGGSPTVALALATRRGETSPIVRNFVTTSRR